MRAGAEPRSLWIRVLRPRPVSLLAVLALLGAACGAEPERPEAELRRTVERIVRGIVAKDPHAVLEYVAPEYRGEDGLRYIDVQSILLTFLLRDGSVRAELESLEVDPAGADGSHRVRATLRFGRGPTQDPGPTVASGDEPRDPTPFRYAFDLVFAHRGASWAATAGSYRRL